MNLQFLNWKISLDNPSEADPDAFFKAFSGWIPESPEVFLDVADYRHVHNGPVIILVGHYLNYSLDGGDGQSGLLCDYKQPMEGGTEEKLRSTLLRLLRAAKRLEADPVFAHKPRFRAWELNLSVNSRALAPNTQETLEALKPGLAKVLAQAYGGGDYTMEHLRDPRRRFSVQVRAEGAPGLTDVLRRLE